MRPPRRTGMGSRQLVICQLISAPHTGDVVQIQTACRSDLVGAVRPWWGVTCKRELFTNPGVRGRVAVRVLVRAGAGRETSGSVPRMRGGG